MGEKWFFLLGFRNHFYPFFHSSFHSFLGFYFWRWQVARQYMRARKGPWGHGASIMLIMWSPHRWGGWGPERARGLPEVTQWSRPGPSGPCSLLTGGLQQSLRWAFCLAGQVLIKSAVLQPSSVILGCVWLLQRSLQHSQSSFQTKLIWICRLEKKIFSFTWGRGRSSKTATEMMGWLPKSPDFNLAGRI